jgi:hypothetical protein
MKNLVLTAFAALAMTAGAKFVDPNPYGNYGPAMKAEPGRPMAIEWHLSDRAAIDRATAPEALEAVLSDEKAIGALLSGIKPGYATDAMTAVRIAAVSQYVMEGADVAWWEFWRDDRSCLRKRWARALLNAAVSSKDDYVAVYCLDQLRWCGLECQAPCVSGFAAKSKSKAVRDMAAMVIDQITGAATR